MRTDPETASHGIDRRTALKAAVGGVTAAAVFAAPRIESFSVAPDYAAAATCQTLAIPAFSSWVRNSTGSWRSGSGQRGYVAVPDSFYAPLGGPIHIVEQDPLAIGNEATITTTLPLEGGQTYTLNFAYGWRNSSDHNRTQTLRAEYEAPGGGGFTSKSIVTTFLTPADSSQLRPGTGFVTIVVPGTGPKTYTFRFRHTFNGSTPSGTLIGNDIAVRPPTVSCA